MTLALDPLIYRSRKSCIYMFLCSFLSMFFKRDGVIFLSGDVHFGEIARYDCAVGYPLYDFTSSGLTQSVEGVVPRPFHYIVRFMAWLTPTTLRLMASNCRYKSCTYGIFFLM